MESDEELMRELARGEEAALEALMNRHAARLHGYLARLCGDGDEADDLCQETWVRVVRAAGRFDPRRRFRPWLYGIASNLARDRARRGAARTRLAARVARAARAESGVMPREADPAAHAELHRRIAALPVTQRAALLLRYFEELSESEIAAALGVPAGTVKSRLHAALRSLRAAEKGTPPEERKP